MPKQSVHPQLINLAEHLDEEELKLIAETVIREYESDLESRSEWEDIHERWAELYYQKDFENDPERTWGSTESIPLLTEACNQFAARSRKAFFPNRDFVSVSLVSLGSFAQGMPSAQVAAEINTRWQTYKGRAERTQKHMNYQLAIKNKNYKKSKDALFLSMAIHGSCFTKAYWDIDRNMPCVDTVSAANLIVPYTAGPVSIEDLPRKTHRIFPSQLQTKKYAMNGFFTSECKPVSDIQSYQSSLEKKNDEVEGVNSGFASDARGDAGLCVVLEQHRFWEIDEKKVGAKKGNKIIVPVIVWVDMESREVKRMTIRYKTDSRGQPLDNRNPVEYFTHYKFFENPDGFLGYGYGHMLAQINSGVNAALRGSLDAATLANDGNMAGFMSQRMNPQDDAGSEIRLQMGKFITVSDNVANIKDGIMQMSFPGPNPALAEIMQYLDQRGQRLGSVTEASTGQIDKIRQSNALMTELEQALELPSNIHMRIVDSLTEELGKVYELNRYYMDDMEVFVINDKPEIVTRDDYSIEAAVAPIFDPRMSTMAQKIARAQTELDAVMRNPVTANDPNVMLNAQRRFYEAIESEDIEELLPQPQQPVEPMRIDDQRAENAVFLSPKGATIEIGVFADQDHEQHLAIIDEFANSQFAQELTPEAAQKLAKHRQEHIAYLYEQQSGLTREGAAAEIEAGGMGQSGGGQAGPQAIEEQVPQAGGVGAGPDMGAAAQDGGGAEGLGGLGAPADGGGAVT